METNNKNYLTNEEVNILIAAINSGDPTADLSKTDSELFSFGKTSNVSYEVYLQDRTPPKDDDEEYQIWITWLKNTNWKHKKSLFEVERAVTRAISSSKNKESAFSKIEEEFSKITFPYFPEFGNNEGLKENLIHFSKLIYQYYLKLSRLEGISDQDPEIYNILSNIDNILVWTMNEEVSNYAYMAKYSIIRFFKLGIVNEQSRSDVINGSQIIDFYFGKVRHTTSNLTITELWGKSDTFYLGTHNWITWLFPSKKRSCSHDSIVIREEELVQFNKDTRLREKVLLSLERVFRLYGFAIKLENGDIQVVKSLNFNEKSKNWLTRGNPNQYRIARILQSLMLIGFSPIAKKWLIVLNEIYDANKNEIGDMMEYWNSSVNNPEEWNRGGRYGKAGGW